MIERDAHSGEIEYAAASGMPRPESVMRRAREARARHEARQRGADGLTATAVRERMKTALAAREG